ncbi:MAG: VanZ family protein [Ignavibacteria bacterium]|nr:VanZ family protein [Ignavibacteria bacterium]
MNKILKLVKQNYKYILLIMWMIAMFMLSSEPSVVSSGRSDLIVGAISGSLHLTLSQEIMTFMVRKSAHTIAYFVLGILIFNIVKDFKFNRDMLAMSVSITGAFLYAVSDELHQLFVQGRSCELRDIMIDTVAATIGVCVLCLTCRFASSKPGSNLHNKSK